MAIKYKVPYQLDVRGVDFRTGQRIMNILYFRNEAAAAPEPAFGTDIAGSALFATLTSFRTVWRAQILPLLSNHYVTMDYRLREIAGWALVGGNFRTEYGEQSILLGDLIADRGGAAGETVPDNVAVSVQKITDKAGKSFRGGLRLSPIPESQQSNGTLILAQHTAWQNALTLYYGTAISNGGAGPESNMLDYVFSRKLFYGTALPMVQSNSFTAFIIDFRVHKNLGTQNTRKQTGDAPIDEAA